MRSCCVGQLPLPVLLLAASSFAVAALANTGESQGARQLLQGNPYDHRRPEDPFWNNIPWESKAPTAQPKPRDMKCDASPYPGMYCVETLLGGSFLLHWGNLTDQTVSLVAEADALGWVGVAFSAQKGKMVGAEAVIGWAAASGLSPHLDTYMLSSRFVEHVNPIVASFNLSNAQVVVVPVVVQVVETTSGRTVMSFTRSRAATTAGCDLGDRGKCEILVAFQSSIDALSMHSKRGAVVLDIAQGSMQPVAVRQPRTAWILHGWLCILGWGLFIPGAVIVSRTLKDLERFWMLAHMWLNIAGLACSFVGLVIGLAAFEPPHSAKHRQLGLAATVLGMLQPINGLIRPPKKPGLLRTAWEWFHVLTGRSAIICALASSYLGIQRYNFEAGIRDKDSRWLYALTAYLICLFLVYLMLEQRRNRILEKQMLLKIRTEIRREILLGARDDLNGDGEPPKARHHRQRVTASSRAALAPATPKPLVEEADAGGDSSPRAILDVSSTSFTELVRQVSRSGQGTVPDQEGTELRPLFDTDDGWLS